MKNLTIATMKEALKMMSIKDTHEAEMMKAVTIFENGGRFIAKWNGSRVIKAGIAVKSSTRKAGYIAIVEAVIECIGEDRWNEIVEVIESIEEATIEADPIESKTKAEIVEKIESIPSEQLSLAVASILYRNPFNEISTNRVYTNKCGSHITGIGFQTNATKQNMVTVYREILNQIALSFGIEEMHKIEAEYTPIWWEDDTNEEAQEATSTNESESEEENTMKNTKGYSFEIRQLDAWGNNEEGYEINTSYHMGDMATSAKDEKRAFCAWIKRHLGISFKPNRTLIEFDGDCYTIIDRKTKEPLFIAIPQY